MFLTLKFAHLVEVKLGSDHFIMSHFVKVFSGSFVLFFDEVVLVEVLLLHLVDFAQIGLKQSVVFVVRYGHQRLWLLLLRDKVSFGLRRVPLLDLTHEVFPKLWLFLIKFLLPSLPRFNHGHFLLVPRKTPLNKRIMFQVKLFKLFRGWSN